jgi:hypothetical protein
MQNTRRHHQHDAMRDIVLLFKDDHIYEEPYAKYYQLGTLIDFRVHNTIVKVHVHAIPPTRSYTSIRL